MEVVLLGESGVQVYLILYAAMVELADAPDLGSGLRVRVQIPLAAPCSNINNKKERTKYYEFDY